MKKKALPVYLDERERQILEKFSVEWGVSLSAAVKRLIRERGQADKSAVGFSTPD